VKLTDSLYPGNPWEKELGSTSKTYVDMRRDTSNPDLEITREQREDDVFETEDHPIPADTLAKIRKLFKRKA
jgi:hypothetical protein